jgi:ribonuclease P protein component
MESSQRGAEVRVAPPRPPEALPRARRIVARRDYLTAYGEGAKRHGRYVVAFARPGAQAEGRLGITVTRKVGDAVVRNLLKRRVREIYRRRAAASSLDVVVNVKREGAAASFAQLRDDLLRVLSALEGRRESE